MASLPDPSSPISLSMQADDYEPIPRKRRSQSFGGDQGSVLPPRTLSTTSATGAVAGLLQHRNVSTDDPGPSGVSLLWAGATLMMSTVGSGLLSLPASFACVGVLPGLALLVATAAAMYFTGVLLLRCHLMCGAASYDELAGMAFKSWAFVVPVVVVIGLFGGCTAYITIAKEVLPDLWAWAGIGGDEDWYWNVKLWTAVLVFGLSFPLCLLRNIGSLRYSSTVGFLFSLYLMGVIAVRGAQALASDTARWPAPLRLQGPTDCAAGWNGVSSSSSVFFFSFVFHLNVCPLFLSLRDEHRTLSNGKRMILSVVILISLLYGATGAMGYALFGSAVSGNILDDFGDPDDDVVNAARIAIMLCCYLCLPLLIHPLRTIVTALGRDHCYPAANDCYRRVFSAGDKSGEEGRLLLSAEHGRNELEGVTPLSPLPEGSVEQRHKSKRCGPVLATMVSPQSALLTVALLLVQYAFAMAVPSIKIIFSLTGGTAVVGFCFLFPIGFALKLLPRRVLGRQDADEGWKLSLSSAEVVVAWIIFASTAALGVWSLGVTIQALAEDGGQSIS